MTVRINKFHKNVFFKYAVPALKAVLYLFSGLLVFILLYFSSAWVLGSIPLNGEASLSSGDIAVYVTSNGVHTDIVVPVKTEFMDWGALIHQEDFEKRSRPFQYISFGWGDKGFFMETPTWAELKASVALNAVFLPSPTAMHVSYLEYPPSENEMQFKIRINEEQYRKLIGYIQDTFHKDSQGRYILIPAGGYDGLNDNFYEANGHYHLFYTCNSWTNEGLKKIGIRAAVWSPFEKAVIHHLNHGRLRNH